MSGRGRSTSRARDPHSGRHFLAGRRLAADLVRNAGVTRADLVWEIGAGWGVLTTELAGRAGRVVAVEIGAELAERLRARFDGVEHVRVIHGDTLALAFPDEPFRVVANLPFHLTNPILRRLLDDPRAPMLRADLIVQWQAAVKRATPYPSTLQTLSWAPWFEFTVTRRLPARSFRPPPAVDAGVLQIVRRPDPLLPVESRPAFVRLLRAGFTRSGAPLRRSLDGVFGANELKRAARRLCFSPDAGPIDLDVAQWVGLYELARQPERTGRILGTR